MASPDHDKRLKAQLEAWRRALINLTRANSLLYLKPGSVLEIAEPGPDEVYARLARGLEVIESRDPELFPDEPPRPLRAGQVRFGPNARFTIPSKLRGLDRTATQAFLDRRPLDPLPRLRPPRVGGGTSGHRSRGESVLAASSRPGDGQARLAR